MKPIFKPRSIYDMHTINYKKSLVKFKKRERDIAKTEKIKERLKKYPIKCYLYKNTIDDVLYQPIKYNCMLHLAKDGNKMIVKEKVYKYHA